VLHGLFDHSLRRFVPATAFYLYVSAYSNRRRLGSRHVSEIAPVFHIYGMLGFHDTAGYIRDLMVKPLSLVIFALLVAAAVLKSERPEKFLLPVFDFCLDDECHGHRICRSVRNLASPACEHESRAFLSPLGMHANDLGRLYAVAYALLLFTWAESKENR